MDFLIFTFVRLSPKNWLSRQFGKLAQMKRPQWLVRPMMRWFASYYQLRLDEALLEFEDFQNLDEMFTRELKPGLRPIGGDFVHPADSQIAQAGKVEQGKIIQAKGWTYSVGDLIGEGQKALELEGGSFITYYLCPTDYHRVHSPVDGQLLRVRHIPGVLWPVNPYSVEHVKNLFAINERLVFELETAYGPVFVVMVGATNVGKISVSVGPDWVSNCGNVRAARERSLETPEEIKAGQELGIFHLGSTAVVIYPKGVEIKNTPLGGQVLMGQPLR